MQVFLTVEEILDLCGGDLRVAGDLGITKAAVRHWKLEKRIPYKNWKKIVETSEGKVSYFHLAALC